MGQVIWSAEAVTNLAAVHAYIAHDSVAIADRVVRDLVASTARLKEFPESGRPVEEMRDRGVREIVVRPYHIAYEVGGNDVNILRVWHGKRMLRPEEILND